jgi:predicted XRE-type DNA-binding protein
MKTKSDITKSCGNVFADLDLPDAETALAKAELARQINAIIRQRGLKQADAAKLLDIDQAKVSALGRGRLAGFSTERLFRFLNALGRDVQIVIRINPTSPKRGHVSILEATPAAH